MKKRKRNVAGAFGKCKNSPIAWSQALLRDLQKVDQGKKPTPSVIHFFTKIIPKARLANQLNQMQEDLQPDEKTL